MPYIEVGRENSGSTRLHYADHGSGRPVVLGHGYPFDRQAWEKQLPMLLSTGHRVIAYDRRGWGRSSQPAVGYDYDTAAGDLDALITSLDLRDAVLIGHSTGTGDVTRYLGTHGTARVRRAVLISPLPPGLLRSWENPAGVPSSTFADYVTAARADRLAWLSGFLADVFNMDAYGGTLVSDQAFQASFNVAVSGSTVAAVDSIESWPTNFHADLRRIDIPVLIVQGDRDRFLPAELTGDRLRHLLPDPTHVVVRGGPNAVMWTHADHVNHAIHEFLS